MNKYQVDVSRENKSDYIGSTNLVYAENDDRMWAYKSCQWYIDEHKDEAHEYNTLSSLLNFAKTQKTCGVETHTSGRRTTTAYSRGYPRGAEAHGLFYAKDVDTYFIFWCYKAELVDTTHLYSQDMDYNWYRYTNRLIPVNQFGRKVVDKDAEDVEMNIVPVWLDYTDEGMGSCIFLECGEMGSAVSWTKETDANGNTTSSSATSGRETYGDETDYNSGALAQTTTGKAIALGEQEKSDAYSHITLARTPCVSIKPRTMCR